MAIIIITFLSLLAIENLQNHFIFELHFLDQKKSRPSKKANLKGTLSSKKNFHCKRGGLSFPKIASPPFFAPIETIFQIISAGAFKLGLRIGAFSKNKGPSAPPRTSTYLFYFTNTPLLEHYYTTPNFLSSVMGQSVGSVSLSYVPIAK